MRSSQSGLCAAADTSVITAWRGRAFGCLPVLKSRLLGLSKGQPEAARRVGRRPQPSTRKTLRCMSADYDLNDIEERAADWIVERDRGFAPKREREFWLWLRADPRHVAVFDALAATWELLDKTTPARIATARSMDADLRWKKLAWFPLTLAAAAAIVIGAGSWQKLADSRAGGGAMQFALTTATEVGNLRKVDLPDGSVIQLNTDSAVDVRFNRSERHVRLTRGEAHFTVAKNHSRPFVVSAAGVDVHVVGTVFNVRLRSESVDVLVTEGKVRVDSLATDPAKESAPASSTASLSELTAGQKVSITLAAT